MNDDLTIVGPEPQASSPRGPRRRINVEALLLMAKYDPAFHRQLFADRRSALDGSGLPFSPGERMLLEQIGDQQLADHIEAFRLRGVSRRSLTNWARAAAVLALLSTLYVAEMGCDVIRPDTGSGPDTTNVDNRGIEPDSSDVSPLGIEPDER